MLGQLAEPYEVIVWFTYRASRSRAMPETEKPPAMPEDIYYFNKNPFSFRASSIRSRISVESA